MDQSKIREMWDATQQAVAATDLLEGAACPSLELKIGRPEDPEAAATFDEQGSFYSPAEDGKDAFVVVSDEQDDELEMRTMLCGLYGFHLALTDTPKLAEIEQTMVARPAGREWLSRMSFSPYVSGDLEVEGDAKWLLSPRHATNLRSCIVVSKVIGDDLKANEKYEALTVLADLLETIADEPVDETVPFTKDQLMDFCTLGPGYLARRLADGLTKEQIDVEVLAMLGYIDGGRGLPEFMLMFEMQMYAMANGAGLDEGCGGSCGGCAGCSEDEEELAEEG